MEYTELNVIIIKDFIYLGSLAYKRSPQDLIKDFFTYKDLQSITISMSDCHEFIKNLFVETSKDTSYIITYEDNFNVSLKIFENMLVKHMSKLTTKQYFEVLPWTYTYAKINVKYYIAQKIADVLFSELYGRDHEEYAKFCLTKTYKSDETYAKELKNFLELEKIPTCFTPKSLAYEINRNKLGLTILRDHRDKLTESEFLEVLRRSGAMRNPDASYRSDFDCSKTITVKEGEGPKLDGKVYHFMNDLFSEDLSENEYPNVDKILENLSKGNFAAGITKRFMDENNSLLLSGNDLHVLIVVEDPYYKDYYIICGMFTSAKDDGTIEVSKNQDFADKDIEGKKSQSIRYSKRLVRIPKKEFEENIKFTQMMKNKQNIDNISFHMRKAAEVFKKHSIERPNDLTKKRLSFIGEKMYEHNKT